MEKKANKQDEEMRTRLILYLSQYCKKRDRKRVLQKRLENFREEMTGTKGMNYSPVPRSHTNTISNEPLEFRIKCEEIEERIEKERKAAVAAMLKVMDILSFLEPESEEKNILEYKYLDGDSWEEITKKASMSRSRCNDYWKIGLHKLLSFAKVRDVLDKFGQDIEEK